MSPPLFQAPNRVNDLMPRQDTLQRYWDPDLFVTVVVEAFLRDDAELVAVKDRECKEALTMHDDNLGDEPIYMLVINRPCRLRVSLKHKNEQLSLAEMIVGVTLKAPEGPAIPLAIEELSPACMGHQVVAYLHPAQLQSDELLRVSPGRGLSEEKYAMLEVTVYLKTDTAFYHELKTRVVCNMVAHNNRLFPRAIIREANNLWSKVPQWIKNALRIAIFIREIFPVGAEMIMIFWFFICQSLSFCSSWLLSNHCTPDS